MPTAGRQHLSPLDHVTRQQLDELDALMQRMLALPVNPAEDLAGPPVQQAQDVMDPESSHEVPASRGAAVTEPANPITPEPVKADEILSLSGVPEMEGQARALVPRSAEDARAPASGVGLAPRELGALTQPRSLHQWADASRSPSDVAHSPPFLTPSPPHPVAPSPPQPTAKTQERVPPPPVAWPLRPLLWVNVAFDRATGWLGPVGHWLRAPGGRALLGWAGLLLLVAAVAWLLLDEMGWTW